MRILGDRIPGDFLKVKWAADHLGLPYLWVDVDIVAGESRTATFLAMNPAGQVPVLPLDDGRALTQSNAILLYLAEGSPLSPTARFAEARMHAWLCRERYSHEP